MCTMNKDKLTSRKQPWKVSFGANRMLIIKSSLAHVQIKSIPLLFTCHKRKPLQNHHVSFCRSLHQWLCGLHFIQQERLWQSFTTDDWFISQEHIIMSVFKQSKGPKQKYVAWNPIGTDYQHLYNSELMLHRKQGKAQLLWTWSF